MNIRLFTLCDGAYNYNGKLTIVGTIDNIKVLKFPAVVNFGIAIKVSFPPSEYGKKEMKVGIYSEEDSNPVIDEITFPSTEAQGKDGDEAKMAVAGNLTGVIFPKQGKYIVRLTVGNTQEILPFNVVK